MAYGTVKCDNVIYDDSGDQTLALNNIATKASPSFTGTITSTAALNQTGAFTQVGEFDINGFYNQTIPAALATTGAVTVDTSLGNYFTLGAMTGNITGFTFSNVPAAGKCYSLTIEITASSTPHTITWGSAIKWPTDTAPALEANKVLLVSLVTDDGGTKWRGLKTNNYTN
tara:strand:+ start:206 stop:718 length:513 start_codon:yes stop_codon:yes gene_type:complete